MADTDECAQRACFRIADVTVMHSVTTSATGLTATVMGRALKLHLVAWRVDATISSLSLPDMAAVWSMQIRGCDQDVVGATGWPFLQRGQLYRRLNALCRAHACFITCPADDGVYGIPSRVQAMVSSAA